MTYFIMVCSIILYYKSNHKTINITTEVPQGQRLALGAVGAGSHNLSFSATFYIIWCLPHIFAYFKIFRIFSHTFSHPAYFRTILIFCQGNNC